MWGKSKQKPVATTQFDTLIAEGTLLRGNVEFSGGLHIDGSIKGNIRAVEEKSAVVRVSEVGKIEGDVIAPHVVINGQVHGDVYASEHLELAEKASITGNVYYNLIEMVIGAEVNGNLVHNREQASEKLGLAATQEEPASVIPATRKESAIDADSGSDKAHEEASEPGMLAAGGNS